MHCRQCGEEWPEEFQFCPRCGVAMAALQAGGGSAAAAGRGIAQAGTANLAFSGDIHGDVSIHQGDPDRTDPAALRQAYLCQLVSQVKGLPLTGVDRKAASDADCADLELAAVYTALRTQRTTGEGRDPAAASRPEGEARRLSAVEVLNAEPRLVLLGDPGSGKSTFVSFVGLCLAGEALGEPQANLRVLTAPLPDKEPEWLRSVAEKPQPQPWDHGPLLPVRIVLRDLAARGLPRPGRRAGGDDLWRFVVAELGENLAEYAPQLMRELREKGGLVLLDGLDEVPEADRRRDQVKQVVAGFAAAFPRCRFLVTSRTYAYQRQEWKLPGFQEAILAPFGLGQIERFVDRWYAHVGALRKLHPNDSQGRAALLKTAIERSERLAELASRPLLLTLMASLHAWRGGSLPERREELYADVVDLLLDQWEGPKVVRDAAGQPLLQQPSLAEWLKVDRQVVLAVLNRLAFQGHHDQPRLEGTADLSQARLVDGLMQAARNPEVNPAQLVAYVRDRAGLLAARGEGIYTFPHRTFQEYLAACHLTDHGFPDELAGLLRADPGRWREVTLLAASKAARGTPFAVWSLAEALCYEEPPAAPREAGYWAALLAAQALAETGQLPGVTPPNRAKVERLRRWLVRLVEEGALPPVDRALAGDALAGLPGTGSVTCGGDPRFDPDAFWLPCRLRGEPEPLLGFVPIPEGPFLMGSDREQDPDAFTYEAPQRTVDLPAYYIARYPVTVAQYRAFVKDRDITPGDADCLRGNDNHPVVWVGWHEALAYCRWLTERLKTWEGTPEPLAGLLRDQGWQVRLPSEAQWEKAARGGLEINSDGRWQPNPNPARRYPWGDTAKMDSPDPSRANYYHTGILRASAVGCFPGGASPYGVLDMSGNVWEWCQTKWQDSYEEYVDDNDLEGSAHRVLRGGAFGDTQWGVRCASRHRGGPHYRRSDVGFRLVVVPVPFEL